MSGKGNVSMSILDNAEKCRYYVTESGEIQQEEL